ncbi:MAG: argininosuccinate lyase [Candidatus Omnitrophota bacterium]
MTKKLWGGRFGKGTDLLVEEFTRSIQYDYKLAKYDVLGSMAHVAVLGKAGILSSSEVDKLTKALVSIHSEIELGKFKFNKNVEDIHSCIQDTIGKKTGDLSLKLHTARSRNDQVAVATKFYCKSELLNMAKEVLLLCVDMSKLANRNNDIIIPGFTHLQHAQPVYLSDYFLAYSSMLKRDSQRLVAIEKKMVITMGAGALAGSPIASELYRIETDEFKIVPVTNSLDSVSDRDFIIEILSALSILGMHLSRFSEDMIIWASKEFNFVEIDDAYCTGSSLMPQKKNPDVLELIRGYAGRFNGNLVSVLTMMKGLPLTYNRDMQLDKEPLFDSVELALKELKVLQGLVKTLKFNKEVIAKHLKDEALYATDIVYYLVEKGIAFKAAHTIVGKLVKYSEDNGIEIKDMSQTMLNKICKELIKDEVNKLFDPKVSVESKKSIFRK